MKIIGKCFKILSVFLFCAATLCCPINAYYSDEEEEIYNEELLEPDIEKSDVLVSGDWQYYDMGDSLCVCGYTGKEEIITIPSEIHGKSVKKISGRKRGSDIFNKKNLLLYNSTVKEVVVPEGITSVGIYTFDCSKIEKITLPESLISIGYRAFYSCTLTSVTIPENVKNIGRRAFGNSQLEEIYLPEGLESIGENAFEGTPLKQIYIPDTVVSIGGYAFSKTDLEEITLPKGLVTVESCILAYCRNLKKVCISEGTVALESDLFDNCGNLEEIYLPSTLYTSAPILNRNNSLKNIYLAADKSEYKTLLAEDSESVTDTFIKEEWRRAEGFSQVYENIKITYNVPVPLTEPITYSKESLKLDGASIMLLIITVLEIIFTALLTVTFVQKIMGIEKEKKAEKIREAEEGFHPEILGVWQCAKCGTPNSPIASYCYKCGKKGGTR